MDTVNTQTVLEWATEAANEELHLAEAVQFNLTKTAAAVKNVLSWRLEINENDNRAFDALMMLNNTAKVSERTRLETVQTAMVAMASLWNTENDDNYEVIANEEAYEQVA